MTTTPTIDPETGKRITSQQALAAVVHWMGSYEGLSGSTLADLLEDGTDDATLLADRDGEGIPADVLAGYRYAVAALAQVDRSFAARAAAQAEHEAQMANAAAIRAQRVRRTAARP